MNKRIAATYSLNPRAVWSTIAAAIAAATMVAGCTSVPKPGMTGLFSQQDRTTDAVIRGDLAVIQSWQDRLMRVNAGGTPVFSYHYAKAQKWLDFARSEYHENDRTGVIEAALKEAQTLIEGLEKKSALSMDTPIIAQSQKLRDDLWSIATTLKGSPHFKCGEHKVAELEVQLVWSGHENQQFGWRHATPYVGIAEDLAKQAQSLITACAAQAAQAAPPPPARAPAPVTPAPAPVTVEKVTLGADALFAFGRSDLKDLLPAGKARIAQMVTDLRRFRQLESVRVTGHADRIGTPENNQRLALARAKTVSQYLVSMGIDETRVFVSSEGETKPVADCPGAASPAVIACLGANRRVELEIRGTR